jgi:hypothetical protein
MQWALEKTKKEYPFIHDETFAAGLASFFRDSDPEYDTLKWNLDHRARANRINISQVHNCKDLAREAAP